MGPRRGFAAASQGPRRSYEAAPQQPRWSLTWGLARGFAAASHIASHRASQELRSRPAGATQQPRREAGPRSELRSARTCAGSPARATHATAGDPTKKKESRRRMDPRGGPPAMGHTNSGRKRMGPLGARLPLAHAGPWAPAGTRLPFGRYLLSRHGPGRTVGTGRHREARRPTRDSKPTDEAAARQP